MAVKRVSRHTEHFRMVGRTISKAYTDFLINLCRLVEISMTLMTRTLL